MFLLKMLFLLSFLFIIFFFLCLPLFELQEVFNINAQWHSLRKWWLLLRPEVKRVVASYGFGDFLSINHMVANNYIIGCLVERFRPETNTFAFPECELVLTPETFARLSGLPAGDKPVNFRTVRRTLMSANEFFAYNVSFFVRRISNKERF